MDDRHGIQLSYFSDCVISFNVHKSHSKISITSSTTSIDNHRDYSSDSSKFNHNVYSLDLKLIVLNHEGSHACLTVFSILATCIFYTVKCPLNTLYHGPIYLFEGQLHRIIGILLLQKDKSFDDC